MLDSSDCLPPTMNVHLDSKASMQSDERVNRGDRSNLCRGRISETLDYFPVNQGVCCSVRVTIVNKRDKAREVNFIYCR